MKSHVAWAQVTCVALLHRSLFVVTPQTGCITNAPHEFVRALELVMATAYISASCQTFRPSAQGSKTTSAQQLPSNFSRRQSCKRSLQCRVSVKRQEFDGTKGDEIKVARDDLLDMISGEERGLRTQKDLSRRTKIIKAIEALAAMGAGSTTTDSRLTAAWRMLWTTEKEQLFIVEKASLFGTEAGDILQVIDVEKGTLNNVVTFPPTGMFLVNSTIQVASAQRVNFRFTSAALHVGRWKVPVPPFGKGWFDCVYLDEKIRLAKDIRGDYLVVDRSPYVPTF